MVTRRLGMRALAILFWLVVITVFLFLPRFARLFVSEKSITIFTFPLLIDTHVLADFEHRTGIKTYVHYYENNDELLVKMRADKQHGYDIIFPSDYAVQLLIKEGVLQKIDRTKLRFFNRLNKKLLNLYFDPLNQYSLPYLWEVYGIGFDKEFFGKEGPEPTWRFVFDECSSLRCMGMNNNVREVVGIAALYLFGKVDFLNKQQLQKVKETLLTQKKCVAVYTDLRADYLLLSRTCPIVVCLADDVWLHNDPGIGFMIPREGSFISIDSVCIPKASTKTDLIYQLVNYLYEAQVMQHHTDKYSFFPSLADVSPPTVGRKIMHQIMRNFEKFHFFKDIATEQELNDLWISLKAK